MDLIVTEQLVGFIKQRRRELSQIHCNALDKHERALDQAFINGARDALFEVLDWIKVDDNNMDNNNIIKVTWHDHGAVYYTRSHKLMLPVPTYRRLTTEQARAMGRKGLTKWVNSIQRGPLWAKR